MQKLIDSQKRALVVCTGAAIGFDYWIESLQKLQKSGFKFDLFLSKSAKQILNLDVIEKSVDFGNVWCDENPPKQDSILHSYPTVIVPALTINTASKISACMADTTASRIILTAMMKQKNVVVAVNGCCPDDPQRIALGYNPNDALRKKLSENIALLKDYGAVLTTAQNLAKKSLQVIQGRKKSNKNVNVSVPNQPEKRVCAENRKSQNKLVSREDIMRLPENTTLTVPSGALITELARDTARVRRITIIKE